LGAIGRRMHWLLRSRLAVVLVFGALLLALDVGRSISLIWTRRICAQSLPTCDCCRRWTVQLPCRARRRGHGEPLQYKECPAPDSGSHGVRTVNRRPRELSNLRTVSYLIFAPGASALYRLSRPTPASFATFDIPRALATSAKA
jgi:hypothetical protein